MIKFIKILLAILILVFIGVWVYLKDRTRGIGFDFNAFNTLWLNFDGGFLTLSFMSFLLINFLRSLRFYLLISKKITREKKKAFNVILLSLPLGFFFTASGLIFRSIFLKKKSAVPVVQTISFFSLGKLIDLFVIGIYVYYFRLYFFRSK